ncbi:outer membrane beta-barrel protein [Ponticaulis sp.]|uniref:outer membrane protein n=1 Tax=Ponticaulis sp. TaxID=2020902 RepID=UPI000B64F008|nr:outer membrane beta-barrel protein [Ponticaulis sp.]MAI90767.1 hypothetical protein [Ponticaulis sp.]OUX98992.1 MAG: hypothetical protein CBB65_10025 [Hyphomonadaceae bacterium TMED5]|tara:strand:+ start:51231 stop:51905 length:675 start_codon:yes stop_codon:yes gene_type:complete
MRQTYIKTILLGASVLAIAGTAQADTGFFVSGGLNSTTLEQSTSRNTGTNEPNTGPAGGASATVTDQDTGVSVFVSGGYEYDLGNNFYVSGELFYADEAAETQTLNNVKVTDIELTSSYGLDVKFGHQVTDQFAVYGLIGVSQFEFDGLASYTFADPTDDLSDEEAAFVYGGGVEIDFDDRWSTFAEVRLVNDLEFDTPVDRGGIQAQDELELTIIRTGLKYRF